MKDILKMKFKAHRLVNYLFYIIIFFIGFFIGFGAKNLNFKNILDQFLFIDNVEARTIATVNGTAIDEDYVYSRFKEKWENFDINTYNKISCGWFNNTTKSLHCVALTTDTFNNKSFVGKDSNVTYNGTNVFRVRYSIPNNKTDAYEFMYETSTNTYTNSKLYDSSTSSDSNLNYFSFYFNNWQSGEAAASNFSVDEVSNSEDPNFSDFDFSSYMGKTDEDDDDPVDEGYTLVTVDGSSINENFIYSKFLEVWPDFDINSHNNIHCYYEAGSVKLLQCYAFDDSTKSKFTCSGDICSLEAGQADMYSLRYSFESNSFVSNFTRYVTIINSSSSYRFYSNTKNQFGTTVYRASNYDRSDLSDAQNKTINKFDFSKKILKFNENLFANDENFKQVCVNNFDTFSITSKEVQGYDDNNDPVYRAFDFIWFPNGMKGISTWVYDSEEKDHVYVLEKDENSFSGWWYWLNTKSEIDLYFGRDNPGMYLKLKDYKNKYDYFNYTFYPFEMTFTKSYHRYQVFYFKDPYIEYLDGTKTTDSTKYCFYIKKEFDVNILNRNQNGDYESTITILGDIEQEDKTYKNEFSVDPSNALGTISNFISKIGPTINFINTQLFNFYISLPEIVRMFIFSTFVILIIILILGMVVK